MAPGGKRFSDGTKMRTPAQLGNRRRYALLLLALVIGEALSGTANAEENVAAYYAVPDEPGQHAQVSAGLESEWFRAIMQTHTVLLQQENAPPPLPMIDADSFEVREDESVPSSSDLPVEELFEDEIAAEENEEGIEGESTLQPLDFDPMSASEIPAPTAAMSNFDMVFPGAVAASFSAAPAMIGDHFGGSFLGEGHTIPLAGGDRRFKVAENASPTPRDRIFFNYNHFHNALRDVNGVQHNLDRFTFGFEKTFLDGMASLETRFPFASGLNSTQEIDSADTLNTEVGNLALALKYSLLRGRNWVASGGVTMALPTGDDFELFVIDTDLQSGGLILDLEVQNDAVHLAPFVGFAISSSDWFAQGFCQVDIDLNGNEVFTSTGGFEGVLQDQNLLFLDISIGHWFFRNASRDARVSAAALITELHYTSTLNDTDDVAGITNPSNRVDVLNATGAVEILIGSSSLRIGAAAPLRDDAGSLFDGEVIFQLSRYL